MEYDNIYWAQIVVVEIFEETNFFSEKKVEEVPKRAYLHLQWRASRAGGKRTDKQKQ